MDWSSIITGGITGLLSGAVSGNLVQYILDKRRIRAKNRYELLDEWDKILNDNEYTYKGIVSHPSHALLISFISPKSRHFLTALLTEADERKQELMSHMDAYYNFFDDELMSLGYDKTGRHEQERIIQIHEGADHWKSEISCIERRTKQELVGWLKQEVLRLKKKWGMI